MSVCIEHTGAVSRATGYGTKWFQGEQRLAHRVAYCKAHGVSYADIRGKVVMHTCDNRKCINSEHLVLGSQADNMADMVAKRRHAKGEMHADSKLTNTDVEFIRSNYKRGKGDLFAKKFGISRTAVWQIVHRHTWKHLP